MADALIAYFTGTGGTAKAADALDAVFAQRGLTVDKQQIKRNKAIPNGEESLLVLLFAVHAANAPKPVHDWLEAKGYRVVYEQTIVMPSNMSVATPDFLARRLLEVLPDRAARIVDDVLGGLKRRVKPKAIDRVMSALCLAEHKGAHHFGKQLAVTDACNGCGWCARSCPGDNIRMENDRPVFGDSCVMCFGCAYGCPQHAIEARRLGFVLSKKGFDIRRYEQLPELPEEKTGLLMAGVRRYLDGDNM